MPSKRISFARKLRAEQTSCEELIWNAVRGRRFRYTTDFCCMAAKLIVEIDGAQHADRIDYDEARRQYIEQQGFVVLRFTNEEVRSRLDWVMQEIGGALDFGQPP